MLGSRTASRIARRSAAVPSVADPQTSHRFLSPGQPKRPVLRTFRPFRGDVLNGTSDQDPTSSTTPSGYRRATEAGRFAACRIAHDHLRRWAASSYPVRRPMKVSGRNMRTPLACKDAPHRRFQPTCIYHRCQAAILAAQSRNESPQSASPRPVGPAADETSLTCRSCS